jgi:hypothetical protein
VSDHSRVKVGEGDKGKETVTVGEGGRGKKGRDFLSGKV